MATSSIAAANAPTMYIASVNATTGAIPNPPVVNYGNDSSAFAYSMRLDTA
jgi:hypothetical protein